MVHDNGVDRTQHESDKGDSDTSTNQGWYKPDDEFKARENTQFEQAGEGGS